MYLHLFVTDTHCQILTYTMRIISDISSLSYIQVIIHSYICKKMGKILKLRPASFTAIINRASKSSNHKQNDSEPHDDSMEAKNLSSIRNFKYLPLENS